MHHSAVIERAFLKDELTRSRAILSQARGQFRRVYNQAKEFLSLYDFVRLSCLLSECDRRQRPSLVVKNKETIARLRKNRFGKQFNDFGTIENLTDITLTTLQKEVLCRGVDFGVPPRKTSDADILAEFELLHRQAAKLRPISKKAAERSRCELAATAREFASEKPDLKGFSLEREHLKALKELRMDHNLVITRPDKGRATVIMKKETYVQKMMVILGDAEKFLKLGPVSEFDRTVKIEEDLRSYLKDLKKAGEICETIFDRIAPTGSQRPQMYGLPVYLKLISPTNRYVPFFLCVVRLSTIHPSGFAKC